MLSGHNQTRHGATCIALISAVGYGLPGAGTFDAPKPSAAQAGRQRFTVTQTAGGCESPAREVFVDVDATPAAPGLTDLSACQNKAAPLLSANGSGLLWYTTASNGTGSKDAPVLSTTATGAQVVYVSQSAGRCEGPRAKLTLTTYPVPVAPTASTVAAVCRLANAPALSAQGQSVRWYTQVEGGAASTQAPTPNTGSACLQAYFATQTVNGCESARTKVEQLVWPLPEAPKADPVRYCLGDTTRLLTAVGVRLRWYAQPTGGASSTVTPRPTAPRLEQIISTLPRPIRTTARVCGKLLLFGPMAFRRRLLPVRSTRANMPSPFRLPRRAATLAGEVTRCRQVALLWRHLAVINQTRFVTH